MLYIISAGYDSKKNVIYLKLYNDKTNELAEWYDDTRFKPYCLADNESFFNVTGLPIENFKIVKKFDALEDKERFMTKGEFLTPDLVKKTQPFDGFYENHIKFYSCYIYDNDIHMGMPHDLINGKLIPHIIDKAEARTDNLLRLFTEKKITRDLIKLFEYPAPDFKRISLDIEVLNEEPPSPMREKWKKISNPTKRFIWLLCYIILKKKCDDLWYREKLEKLMKNIENENENMREDIENTIEKSVINGQENGIEEKDKTQLKEKEQDYVQKVGVKIIENICKNICETGYMNEKRSLSNLKVENVNDVELLMNELLKSTTSMDEEGQIELFMKLLEKWIGENFNSFVPIAIELFTMSEESNKSSKKVPRPEVANLPVLCICMKTADKRVAFLLRQPNKQLTKYPDVDELYIFTEEKEMLLTLFAYIQKFPFLITFNGDGFDLMYLRNRAFRFGIPNDYVPIEVAGRNMLMRSTIHIDLYRFFEINAIRNYAFLGKYKDVELNTLGKVFLNKEKLSGGKWVGEMEYYELINYCMRDAEITYELTSFNDNLTMNLILAIVRISRLPVEEVTRKAVGRWIASFLYYLHRKLGYLIPRPEDINLMKGKTTTTSIIKGKQFQAALVIKPKGGTYFDAKVVDYGSLYPSVIKNFNIGYETIRCKHGELWQKLSNETKRLIYEKLYDFINSDEVIKCQNIEIEKIKKLMENIEMDIPNIIENIQKKIKNNSNNIERNIINEIENELKKENENIEIHIKNKELNISKNITKTIEKKIENIKENDIKNEYKTQNIEKNEMKIAENGGINSNNNHQKNIYNTEEIKIEKDMNELKINSSNLKVINANDVEILMRELLKCIISMDEQKVKEILEKLSPDIIGQNYNSFVPIVTELLDISECGSNKYGGLPHWICKKQQALESIFIGSLRDLRLQWYKKQGKNKDLAENDRNWYKVVEQTIKVFMNASFGVFSTKGGFAFHCPSASEEIAGIGRSIITATVEEAKREGIEVIYGDTDSIVIREQNMDKIKNLQEWASNKYQIDLELDKEYRLMCFSSRKKNYLGIQPNGDIDIKGLTGKKSHTPRFFKNAFGEMKEILQNVQDESGILKAREDIQKLVLETYKKLKNRQWDDISDLAFHMTVNKKISEYKKTTPQHIKAVHQLEQAGYAPEAGSIIEFIKAKNKDGVLALELAEDKDVDIAKYTEFLQSMFEQVLDTLDMSFSEIIGYKKLESFG